MNKKFFTIIFLTVTVFVFYSISDSGQIKGVTEKNLAIYFLDIGQGDATLIRTPEGDDIIIDGGPDNKLVQKLGQYLPFYDRTIETIILTHPHDDHLAGLIEVLKRYKVEQIIMTGVDHESASYKIFLDSIGLNTKVKLIKEPETVLLSDSVAFDIFWPQTDWYQMSADNINNTSVAGRLIYTSTSVMFTGDLETEESLLDLDIDLESDIYQVGHHGSNNANDLTFIEAVSPQYSVISAGEDNRFGHPHYRTLKNLERVGSSILRTDALGDIILVSDGDNWKIVE